MASRKPLRKATQRVIVKPAAGGVRASAQDIWMAGLGAFAKAQDDGNRLFELLVAEGRRLQDKLTTQADVVKGKFGDTRITDMVDRFGDGLEKISQIVEGGTSSVLNKAGVATRQEVDALSRRVSKLAKEVERLVSASKPVAPALGAFVQASHLVRDPDRRHSVIHNRSLLVFSVCIYRQCLD